MSTAPRPMRLVSSRAELPEDPRQRIGAMAKVMTAHVADAIVDERFVAFARRVTSDGRRATSPVVRARKALRRSQRLGYVWDPAGRERMQTARATAALGFADCNSNVVFFAALAAAVGLSVRLVFTKTEPGAPEWGHVYAEVQVGDLWYAADPSPLGMGASARYLPLGQAPIEPIEPLRVDATDRNGQLTGFLDSVGHAFGQLFEGVKDLVTLQYARKALRYGWQHMGKEMRTLCMVVGPKIAEFYLPGVGEKMSKAALQILENDRLSRREKKRRQKEMAAAIKDAEAKGLIAKGAIDVHNPQHLAAIALAAQMPPDVARAWYQQQGLAPPAPSRGKASGAASLLAVAAVLAAAVSLPAAAVLGAGAFIVHQGQGASS